MNKTDRTKEYYDSHVMEEWNRLESENPVEFVYTTAMMEKYIDDSNPQRILDIGSGPGRYSIHFAKKGHDLTLLDISEQELDFAKNMAEKENCKVSTICIDAAEDYLPGQLFDHIFIMGPLYHENEEKSAIIVKKALEHLNEGGIVYCSFLTNFARILHDVCNGPGILGTVHSESDINNCVNAVRMGENFEGKNHSFMAIDRIPAFMEKCGTEKLVLFGQRGMFTTLKKRLSTFPEKEKRFWLDAGIKMLETKESLYSSDMVMYIGTKIKRNTVSCVHRKR